MRRGVMSALMIEIQERRARRALSEQVIPDEVIERLMTAATYAPSCFNNQGWRFLVATSDEALEKMHNALADGNYWAKRAPVMLAVVTKPDLDCRLSDRRDYALFDCGLAVESMVLQAMKEGIIAHPMAGFDPLKVKEAFQIADEYIVIALVALGYPSDDTSFLNEKHLLAEQGPRTRKPETEVICYNAWELGEAD
jgi:nitroreductase